MSIKYNILKNVKILDFSNKISDLDSQNIFVQIVVDHRAKFELDPSLE